MVYATGFAIENVATDETAKPNANVLKFMFLSLVLDVFKCIEFRNIYSPKDKTFCCSDETINL